MFDFSIWKKTPDATASPCDARTPTAGWQGSSANYIDARHAVGNECCTVVTALTSTVEQRSVLALASGEGNASRHRSTAATGALQRLNVIIGKQTRERHMHGNVAGGSRRLPASSLDRTFVQRVTLTRSLRCTAARLGAGCPGIHATFRLPPGWSGSSLRPGCGARRAPAVFLPVCAWRWRFVS